MLLQKSELLGTAGNLLNINASYLNKTIQYVKLIAFNSETVQVTIRVPQGSLLGCEAFGYADDFKLVATNSQNKQYDVKQIEEWCLNNKTTLNEYKCYILQIKSQDKPKLSLNNKTLNTRASNEI